MNVILWKTARMGIGRGIILLLASVALASIAINIALWSNRSPVSGNSIQASEKELYTCPMHPQVVNDHPSDCPICGMKLVKKATGGSTTQIDSVAGSVHVSPSQEVLANIKTSSPVKSSFTNGGAAPGRIVIRSDSEWKLSLRTMARVDSLFVSEPGTSVKQGDPIAIVFSPDLRAAEQEYLVALSNGVNEAAEEKLLALGLESRHLDELRKTRKPHDRFVFHALKNGSLMEKMAKVGEWSMAGMTLLDFVDLSSVWVEAHLFEKDVSSVRMGDRLTIEGNGERITATVSFLGKELDMMTRSLPVRASIDNRNGKWIPGMFVSILWSGGSKEFWSVPEDAVLQTGTQNRVWVKRSDGRFQPVAVTVGPREKGHIAILAGLDGSEQVAITGAYLLDSESIIQNAANGTLPILTEPKAATSGSDHKHETSKPMKGEHKFKYVCPMNCPGSGSDSPGKCPVCGMNLEESEE